MVELFQLWVLAGQKRGLESAFEEMISRAKSSTTSGWGTRPRRCQWRTLVCIGNLAFVLRRRSQWASVSLLRPFHLLRVAPRFRRNRRSNWFYNF